MKKLFYFLFGLLIFNNSLAATTSTAINNVAYTQINGPGGTGYAITAYLAAQCMFKSTQPTLSTVGHRLGQGETLSVDSMGSGIYLWCKSEPSVSGANFITATDATDAGIGGNTGASSTSDVNIAKIGGTNYALGQTTMSASAPVAIASNQSAIPISAASLPLPSGAATSAKQPALGTAGTASIDVITVQGIASMTAIKTDSSATTQPVSGTVTANAGTNLNTSLLALESGNLASIKTDVDKIPSQGIADASASTPVVIATAGIPTQRNGTITSGGTAQNAMAANTTRRQYRICNISTTNEFLYVNDKNQDATSSNSIPLSPVVGTSSGGCLYGESTARISVLAVTTGHAWEGMEY